MSSIVEEHAFELTHTLVPPAALRRLNLIMEYRLSQQQLKIYPLDEYGFDSFSMDLSLVFQTFKVEKVIKIILFLLTEQKTLFVSSNHGSLTPVIQCFLRLLCPFKWHLPYVPLLSYALIEYLEAPHPFIMGLNSTFLDQISYVQRQTKPKLLLTHHSISYFVQLKENDIIVVDIDKGELTVPDTVDIIDFPASNVATFVKKLSEIGFNNVHINLMTM